MPPSLSKFTPYKIELELTHLSLYASICFPNFLSRAPSLSQLTPMIFNSGLTHLGSEASECDLLVYSLQRGPQNPSTGEDKSTPSGRFISRMTLSYIQFLFLEGFSASFFFI